MANRYLVAGAGGTKNWSDTSIWSATSGGTTGETAPTSSDAVIMDAASLSGSLILTLDAASACASLDSSALDNICTITGSVYTLSIYGSLTEHATNSRYNLTGTSYLYFKGTGTITTNGNTYHTWNRMYIDGVGITVTNGDDCNLGASVIYLTNGTWTTNNKAITSTGSLAIETGIKVLNWGSSIVKLNTIQIVTASNLTWNEGTSTFELSSNTHYTYNNIPFYNLTIINKFVSDTNTFTTNLTVTNNFIITGNNSTTRRILVQSNTIGTPRTITCNGTITATNCDFQDITLAGTASRDFSSQTDIGDAGGCSGITFPASVACHAKAAANFSVSDATKWFLADLTTPARVPLPQDSATFGAGITAPLTISMNCPRIGSIDMSGCSQAVTFAVANAFTTYKGMKWGTVSISGNFLIRYDPHGKTNTEVWLGVPSGYTNNFDVVTSGTYTRVGVEPGKKFRITGGTTQTIETVEGPGTTANRAVITSTNTTPYTLTPSGGRQIGLDGFDISYCNSAAYGNVWAINSTDQGNNTNVANWIPQVT